jgi:hypothetical protein
MYMGKRLTISGSAQRKLTPDIVGLEFHKPTSLRGIAYKVILIYIVKGFSLNAKASDSEEPGAVIPHAGIFAGAVR